LDRVLSGEGGFWIDPNSNPQTFPMKTHQKSALYFFSVRTKEVTMEDPKPRVVNINEASMDELCTLPGVGESLAERITAARPFEYLEDLENVSGIGPNFVDNLSPYVDLPLAPTDGAQKEAAGSMDEGEEVIEDAAPEAVAEEDSETLDEPHPDSLEEDMPEGVTETDETTLETAEESLEAEATEITADEEEMEPEEGVPTAPAPTPAGTSRSFVYGIAFLAFFFALVIATALSVGIIASLNNGNLMFSSANQAAVLSAEIDQLDTSIQALQSDLDSLRVRVDSLEALGNRVDELETTVTAFQEDLNATTSQVEDLDQRFVGMESDMDQVKGSVERFQVFFEGLRELLANVLTPEETNQ
jgi:hypothetical protein